MQKITDLKAELNEKDRLTAKETYEIKGGNGTTTEDDKRRERPGGLTSQAIPDAAGRTVQVKK